MANDIFERVEIKYLLSKEQYETNLDMEYRSTITKLDDLDNLKIDINHVRCNGCENHCLLTVNKFSNNSKYISEYYNKERLMKMWDEYYHRIYENWKTNNK